MDNINWKLVFDGISSLSRALPTDDRTRRWMILGLGAVILVAAAATAVNIQNSDGPNAA